MLVGQCSIDTKWLPFCRQLFQIHFICSKIVVFWFKSGWDRVMVWCHQASGHYLIQWWSRFINTIFHPWATMSWLVSTMLAWIPCTFSMSILFWVVWLYGRNKFLQYVLFENQFMEIFTSHIFGERNAVKCHYHTVLYNKNFYIQCCAVITQSIFSQMFTKDIP